MNAAMIAVCLNFFLLVHCYDKPWFEAATRWGTLGFVLLSLASWWSWRMLCLTEYLKIREHAEFLRQKKTQPRLRNAA